jgi:hypothetical protein
MNRRINPLIESADDRWLEPRPVWWEHLRQSYDHSAAALTRLHLSGTVRAVDALGRLARRVGVHGPSPREVAALFEWLPPDRLAGIARDIAALRFKNRLAIALVNRGGTARLSELVRPRGERPSAAQLDRDGSRIIATWHVGAIFGIRAAMHRIGRRALTLRDLPLEDSSRRTRALKEAVDHLRAGGLVIAMLDGPGGTSTGRVECLGRSVAFRRGPFALARITRAPLVPVVCTWTRRMDLELRVSPPLQPPVMSDPAPIAFEDELASSAARWLDVYLRAEPQEIWLSTLRNFLGAAPARLHAR